MRLAAFVFVPRTVDNSSARVVFCLALFGRDCSFEIAVGYKKIVLLGDRLTIAQPATNDVQGELPFKLGLPASPHGMEEPLQGSRRLGRESFRIAFASSRSRPTAFPHRCGAIGGLVDDVGFGGWILPVDRRRIKEPVKDTSNFGEDRTLPSSTSFVVFYLGFRDVQSTGFKIDVPPAKRHVSLGHRSPPNLDNRTIASQFRSHLAKTRSIVSRETSTLLFWEVDCVFIRANGFDGISSQSTASWKNCRAKVILLCMVDDAKPR